MPASELKTLQLMTSQIRSHIKYLTQAYKIFAHFMFDVS